MRVTNSYRELIAWQKGMTLVKETYSLTKSLPDEEKFGLMAQMRRCAISIPSNIAEGCGRETGPDFVRFLYTARASSYELSTQAEICEFLGYGEDFQHIVVAAEEVSRIINGLIASLKQRNKQ